MQIKSNSIVGIDLTGKILVLKEVQLSEEYRTVGNRLWRASGGFGCSPDATCRALFCECLSDGEKSRWYRYYFEGWISEDQADALMVKERVLKC